MCLLSWATVRAGCSAEEVFSFFFNWLNLDIWVCIKSFFVGFSQMANDNEVLTILSFSLFCLLFIAEISSFQGKIQLFACTFTRGCACPGVGCFSIWSRRNVPFQSPLLWQWGGAAASFGVVLLLLMTLCMCLGDFGQSQVSVWSWVTTPKHWLTALGRKS